MQEARNRSDIERKKAYGQLEKVFQAATVYFGREIVDLEDLYNLLSDPPKGIDISSSKSPRRNGVDGDTQGHLIKEKKKVKALRIKIQESQTKVTQLQKQLDDDTKKYQKDIGQLQAQIKKYQEDLHHKEQSISKKKERAEEELKRVESELLRSREYVRQLEEQVRKSQNSASRRSTISETSPELTNTQPLPARKPNDTPRRSEIQSNRDNELGQFDSSKNTPGDDQFMNDPIFAESHVEMQRRINDLIKQNNNVKEKKKQLDQHARDLEKQLRDFESEKNKIKSELNSLQLVHNETLCELETFRNTVQAHVSRKDKPGPKKLLIVEQKATIKNLESQVSNQQNQIKELSKDNNSLKFEIDTLNRNIHKIDDQLNELKEQNEGLQSNNEALQIQIEQNRPITEDDILPRTIFRCNSFDSTLNSILEKVAQNRNLSAALKVQNAFTEIAKYYLHQIRRREKELSNTLADVQTIRESFNQFLVDFSICLTGKPFTFDEFFGKENSSAEIVEAANSMNLELAELRRREGQYQAVYDQAKSNFKQLENAANIPIAFNTLRKIGRQIENDFLKEKKENRNIKNALNSEKQRSKEIQQKLEEENTERKV